MSKVAKLSELKAELKLAKKQEQTERIHNEIKMLNYLIDVTKKEIKIEELTTQMNLARSNREYDRLAKRIEKLKSQL